MSLRDLPKVELHLHLEGAAPPAFIRGLAQEKGIDVSGAFTDNGNYRYGDFDEFLRVYEAATSVLTSAEDYARLTRAVLEELASHNVVYAETFVSPDFMGGAELGAWREYLAAMEEVARETETRHGITLRTIVTCIRHFGPEKARPVAEVAAETAGSFLTGFGMGGAENVGEPKDYAWAFDCAREAGLRLTCHGGEWRGPQSVRSVIDDLGCERVGHGVRAIEDPELVEQLAEREITLEVCPGSNVWLGVYPDLGKHPIARLRDAGVRVTVSTDDPPFFDTTMTREYEGLERAFRWDDADFAAINRTAVEAAFCDAQTKARLLKVFE